MTALQKAYQSAAREVQQAAGKAQVRAIRALNAGDIETYKRLLADYKKLNDYLVEYGFQRLQQINDSHELQAVLNGLRQATEDIRHSRRKIDKITDAVEQTGKIVEIVEKLIKTAAKFSLPIK